MASNRSRRRSLFLSLKRHISSGPMDEVIAGFKAQYSFEKIAASGIRFIEMPGVLKACPAWLELHELGDMQAWIFAELAHGSRGGYDGMLKRLEDIANADDNDDADDD